ncbi:MAG: OmpH family outer membrane protein [Ignavibacteria bacterium]|nr:OmpH family outer membrane protein [Ignavibacteria bacterium]
MKQTIFTLLFSVLFFSAVYAQAQSAVPATLKIGYVDSEVIFQQFPEAIKAKGQLEAFSKSLNEKLDSMGMALQTALGEYRKLENTMPEAKKTEQQQKLVAQQQAMEEFRRGAQGEVMQKQDKILKPVKEKIIKMIEVVAKEENMQFVFDKPEEAILLYADSNFDLTFKVLDKLTRKK